MKTFIWKAENDLYIAYAYDKFAAIEAIVAEVYLRKHDYLVKQRKSLEQANAQNGTDYFYINPEAELEKLTDKFIHEESTRRAGDVKDFLFFTEPIADIGNKEDEVLIFQFELLLPLKNGEADVAGENT